MRYKKCLGIVLWLSFVMTAEKIWAEQKAFSSRFDLALVQDSNVFETLHSERTDLTVRLLLHCSWKRRFFNGMRLVANYEGGFEGYHRVSRENRTVNEWIFEGEVPIKTLGAFGLHFKERIKTFFYADRGYSFLQGSPYMRWRLRRGLNSTAFFTLSNLNYAGGSFYDYHTFGGGIRLDWDAASWMLLTLQGTFGGTQYQRPAFGFYSHTLLTEQWIALEETQRDSFHEFSLQLESTRWIFLRMGMGYEINDSNNYGYAFRRPKVRLLAIKNIASDWTISVFWTSQVKRYEDSLRPIVQIHPENENEENNFFLIDLTKTIAQSTSLRLQAGLYRNESPFRDLYYRKTLFSIGMTHTF